MNITDRRNLPTELYPFIKLLQYPQKDSRIKILGSAGFASQRFYSDYDLFTKVRKNPKCYKTYIHINEIIEKTSLNPNMYFIEFKLETTKGLKYKVYPNEAIDFNKFCEFYKDIEFIKLDYIIRIENRFLELSIIYSFNPSKTNYIDSIKNDIKTLTKEKKYFKVLKRIFSLLTKQKKSIDRDNKLIILSKFFNSPIGLQYQNVSNLKALKILLENYNDVDTIKKVELNLKDLRLNLKDISKLEKDYNKEAKKLLNLLLD